MGPEAAVGIIFEKARANAPCYLIFEDLDSLVTDGVRSYFLNQIDGLNNNDGIFIVGSTNHLDRLDPGIAVCVLLPVTMDDAYTRRNAPPVSIGSTSSQTRAARSAWHIATSGKGSYPTTTTLSFLTSSATQLPTSPTISALLTSRKRS